MRDLEACKAEIFRRSEIRIKKRKTIRNRVIAVCLPVCFCVGAFAVWGMGQQKGSMENAMDVNCAAPESYIASSDYLLFDKSESMTMENTSQAVCQVTINGENGQDMADRILPKHQYEYVERLFGQDYEDSVQISGDEFKSQSTGGKIRIVFTMTDGSEKVYILTGNILCQESTGKTVVLEEKSLRDLKLMLGIPLSEKEVSE